MSKSNENLSIANILSYQIYKYFKVFELFDIFKINTIKDSNYNYNGDKEIIKLPKDLGSIIYDGLNTNNNIVKKFDIDYYHIIPICDFLNKDGKDKLLKLKDKYKYTNEISLSDLYKICYNDIYPIVKYNRYMPIQYNLFDIIKYYSYIDMLAYIYDRVSNKNISNDGIILIRDSYNYGENFRDKFYFNIDDNNKYYDYTSSLYELYNEYSSR